jgi:hypothetical protein
MYMVRVINSTSTYCMGRLDFIPFHKRNRHSKAVCFGCLHAINFIAMVYGKSALDFGIHMHTVCCVTRSGL